MKVKDELQDDFEMLRRCIIEGNVEGAKEVVFECEKKFKLSFIDQLVDYRMSTMRKDEFSTALIPREAGLKNCIPLKTTWNGNHNMFNAASLLLAGNESLSDMIRSRKNIISIEYIARVDHNHGLCICRNCLSSREDVLDQEVSPVLPIYAESSCNSSTKNRADLDDNNNYCALLHSIPEGSDAVDVFNTQVLATELPSYEASSQDCDLPGARPQQAFASPNSPSQQYWNCVAARPQELQYSTCASQPQQDDAFPVFTRGRRFSATTDWVSPVVRPQQVQHSPVPVDESLQFDGPFDGERERAGENLVGINIAFLLRHSTDEALYTWALNESILLEEDFETLRARIKTIEMLIREKTACKEEESQEMNSCNVPIHTAHKVPVQNCVSDNEIVDGQHQERYPCHPDICCICQEHIDASFGCYEVPCGHKCHTDCYLNMLLDNIDTCPLCRQPI